MLYLVLMGFLKNHAWLAKGGKYLAYFIGLFIFAAFVNWYQAPSIKDFAKQSSIEVTTLAGQRATLNTADGKKTVLYFFAPWCAVCKVSMDALNSFVGSDRLQTIAVGLDYDSVNELKPFQEKVDTPIYAGTLDVQRRFRVDKYPTVYILNGDGSVAHVMVGYTSRLGIWLRTIL